tara:strand:- start:510 stop:1076 length:567 start_codon:yes stop_codon:yes gene_type:complete
MTRRFFVLVSVLSAVVLQGQVFGPGGVVQGRQLGSPIVTPPVRLPGAPSWVYVQPPQTLPVYGPQLSWHHMPMGIHPAGFGVMPQSATGYTLPATVLGGIAGGLIGEQKGKTVKGAAIGAAAGLVLGQVLDRQTAQRRALMPYAANGFNPYFSMGHVPGSYMIITPPRLPATWVSSSMFGRDPNPYVR